MIRLAPLALLVAAPAAAPAAAQVTAPRISGCVDVSDARAKSPVRVRGMLARKVFPGPPNFTSVAKGDAAEPGYLLRLPTPICVDDRDGGFADPKARFREVQVWADGNAGAVEAKLRAAVGRRVTLVGTAMPAQTGHHQRPMVLNVTSVRR